MKIRIFANCAAALRKYRALVSAGLCFALLLAGASAHAAKPVVTSTSIVANPTRLIVSWVVNDGGTALASQEIRLARSGGILPGWTNVGDVSARQYIFTGLSLNTEYILSLRATNTNGEVSDGAFLGARTLSAATTPHAPTGGMVTPGNTELRVSWTLPYDGGSALTRQEIRSGLTGGDAINSASWVTIGAAATSHTITGLANGEEYDVEVRGVNTAGDGASLSLSGMPRQSAPGAPTITQATPGPRDVMLVWTAPANDGDSPITAYHYRWSNDGDESVWEGGGDDGVVIPLSGAGETNATSFTVEHGNGARAYAFAIGAENAHGTTWSASFPAAAVTAFPPGGLVATTKNTGLLLTWSEPVNNSASPVTQYRVRWRVKDSGDYQTGDVAEITGTELSHRIPDLTNGMIYQVQVASKNANGFGLWSDPVEGTPMATTPEAPAITSLTATRDRLVVSWSAPAEDGGSPVTTYRHRWSHNPEPENWLSPNGADGVVIPLSGAGEANAASFEVFHHNGAVGYTLAIGAGNAHGVTWSSPMSVDPVTAFPSTPNVENKNTALLLTWAEPDNNSNEPVTNYRVRWRIKGSGDYQGEETEDAGLSYLITGLINGMIYQVQVASKNENGFGRWSNEVEGTPILSAPEAPAITSLTGTATHLMVSWSAPALDGGSPITTYRYRWSNDGDDSNWESAGGADGVVIPMSGVGETNAASFTLVHDDGAVGYTLAISAGNVTGITWSSPMSVAAVTAFPPNTLTVENKNTALLLTWSEPRNDSAPPAPVTDYRVRWKLQSSMDYAPANFIDTADAALSHRLTGLDNEGLINGMIYQVQVASRNDNGLGRWSNEAQGTPMLTAPEAPAITSLSGTATSLMVSWSAPARDGGSPVTTYRYRWSDDGDDTNWESAGGEDGVVIPLSGAGETNAASFTLVHDDGDAGAVGYTLAIGAGNVTGITWSSPMSVAAVTAFPPTSLSATAGIAALTLTWGEPNNNSASPISGYRVRWKLQSATDYAPADVADTGGTALSYILSGLENQAYHAQVAALNANDANIGQWSNQAGGTPAAPPLPDKVQPPTTAPISAGVRVTWEEPASVSGLGTVYLIRWKAAAETDYGEAVNVSGVTYNILGLALGTYQVQVAARNTAGDGEYSDPVDGIAGKYSLDADQSGGITAPDGIMLTRYLLGVRGGSLVSGQSDQPADMVEENLKNGADSGQLDIDGNSDTDGTDGILLGRYLLGLRGEALIANLGLDQSALAGVLEKLRDLMP